MKCPECGAESSVLETRDASRRRRKCQNGHRFTTMEVVVPEGLRLTGYRARLAEGIEKVRQQKDERRREIAKAEGKLKDVADQFGCSISHVWHMRRAFGERED